MGDFLKLEPVISPNILEVLPPEIIENCILPNLEEKELLNLRLACKELRKRVDHHKHWNTYKTTKKPAVPFTHKLRGVYKKKWRQIYNKHHPYIQNCKDDHERYRSFLSDMQYPNTLSNVYRYYSHKVNTLERELLLREIKKKELQDGLLKRYQLLILHYNKSRWWE